MPLHFDISSKALSEGWNFTTPFTENLTADPSERYQATAEKGSNIGCIEKIFKYVSVLLLRIVTCGLALKNETIRTWHEQVNNKKTVETIFCKALHQPKIGKNSWGEITIEGYSTPFKDVVLLPGTAQNWDWNWSANDKMAHHPGIRVMDIDHYLLSSNVKPDVAILSRGRENVLQVDEKLSIYLKTKGITEVYIQKTEEAIVTYNKLCEMGSKKVAALIHSTC